MFLAAMRQGETPVHIPNTKVKALPADDTRLATARESRRLPDKQKSRKRRGGDGSPHCPRFMHGNIPRGGREPCSVHEWLAEAQPVRVMRAQQCTLKTSYRKRTDTCSVKTERYQDIRITNQRKQISKKAMTLPRRTLPRREGDRSGRKGHRADALAPGAEERRDKLR